MASEWQWNTSHKATGQWAEKGKLHTADLSERSYCFSSHLQLFRNLPCGVPMATIQIASYAYQLPLHCVHNSSLVLSLLMLSKSVTLSP